MSRGQYNRINWDGQWHQTSRPGTLEIYWGCASWLMSCPHPYPGHPIGTGTFQDSATPNQWSVYWVFCYLITTIIIIKSCVDNNAPTLNQPTHRQYCIYSNTGSEQARPGPSSDSYWVPSIMFHSQSGVHVEKSEIAILIVRGRFFCRNSILNQVAIYFKFRGYNCNEQGYNCVEFCMIKSYDQWRCSIGVLANREKSRFYNYYWRAPVIAVWSFAWVLFNRSAGRVVLELTWDLARVFRERKESASVCLYDPVRRRLSEETESQVVCSLTRKYKQDPFTSTGEHL